MTLDELRTWYVAERPRYSRLAQRVERTLIRAVKTARQPWRVTSRPKDLPSLLRKQMLKNYDGPERFSDLAGARLSVTVPEEREAAGAMIKDLFHVHRMQNKLDELDPNEIGYLGIHYDVSLRGGPSKLGDLKDLRCEIQLHTQAQGVWNDTSHKVLYKGLIDPPRNVARAVYRVMAILETVDDEIGRAYKIVMDSPAYETARLMEHVENLFFGLAAPDVEYSRDLTRSLVPILLAAGYHDVAEARNRVDAFVVEQRDKLLEVFTDYRGKDEASPLLFQPEILLLLERLQNAPLALEGIWNDRYPPELLQQISAVWGALV